MRFIILILMEPLITRTTKPDPFTVLPDDLAEMIAEAINKVYQEDGDPETELW